VINDIVIAELESTEEIPYRLLLIADPSKDSIDKYIFNSVIYTVNYKEQTIGCCVLCNVMGETFEIKNIVIDEKHQGKGLGTILLNNAIDQAKLKGAKRVIIGTGNSSIGQLYLYRKVGFRITGIKADFFKKNYKERIVENGIECRDLIILTKEL
jgi:aminoglycoside 6'-N-acetyltransferase I